MSYEHDIFVSHATEDKDAFVRPLTGALTRFGLKIWFDELSLNAGESLSKSIDRGLGASRFGVVVLSEAFFAKKWSEYELRGLTTREIDGKSVILPVWYGVSREQVANFSAPLADKFAIIATGLTPIQVAVRILKVVNPERYENLSRWLLWQKLRREAPTAEVKLSDLNPSPVRHATLPRSLLHRIFLIDAVLGDVSAMSLERTIENFQRDLNPHEEIGNWEHLTAAFVYARSDSRLAGVEPAVIFKQLLGISVRGPEATIGLIREDSTGHLEAIADAYIDVGPWLEQKLSPIPDVGSP